MGGDVGRGVAGVATGGLSEIVNAATGGSIYKKKKKSSADPAAAAALADEKARSDPYNMASRVQPARRSFLASEQGTTTDGKSTVLGG